MRSYKEIKPEISIIMYMKRMLRKLDRLQQEFRRTNRSLRHMTDIQLTRLKHIKTKALLIRKLLNSAHRTRLLKT